MRIEDTHFSAYTEKTESKAQGISLFHVILMLKKERSWEGAKIFPYFCKVKYQSRETTN